MKCTFKEAEIYFKSTLPVNEKTEVHGRKLYQEHQKFKFPHVGISLSVINNFLDRKVSNIKNSEFEESCFLAFVALKSINGKKAYIKINYSLMYARMDGKANSIEFPELSKEILKYHTEHYHRKIIEELEMYWQLRTFSENVRGFYASFKFETQAELNRAVIKKTKSYKKRIIK